MKREQRDDIDRRETPGSSEGERRFAEPAHQPLPATLEMYRDLGGKRAAGRSVVASASSVA